MWVSEQTGCVAIKKQINEKNWKYRIMIGPKPTYEVTCGLIRQYMNELMVLNHVKHEKIHGTKIL